MIRPLTPAWKVRPVRASAIRRSATVKPLSAPARSQVELGPTSRHVLADTALSTSLRRRADEIEAAFAEIEPTLRALVPKQFERDFPETANAVLAARLGFTLPPSTLATSWTAPLNIRELYARCVLRTFRRLIERAFDRDLAQMSDGESAATLINRWGFHAIDITPCADGRLSGVVDYILRIPPAVVTSKQSYAGAMFDVEESVRHWEMVELRRWRQGQPNAAVAATQFLKIGVYHFSSLDPDKEGCAAHGSNDLRAASTLLERLENFATAVQQTHCCDAAAATLLVGVDTDTDALRVHVPDASGRMEPLRYVDNTTLYHTTSDLTRDAAKDVIRDAVAACAHVPPDHGPTEGMRWFCGYLLKNNIGQIDAVRAWHGDAYTDRSHTERLIVVGDAVDDVQLRNLAFQTQMTTVEEGAADLDIGMHILDKVYAARGLAIPVLVHFRYDPRIPGSERQAKLRAQRLRAAIMARCAQRVTQGELYVAAVVRAGDGTGLTELEPTTTALSECAI